MKKLTIYTGLLGIIIVIMVVGFSLRWVSLHHPDKIDALGNFLFASIYFFIVIFGLAACALVAWLIVTVINHFTVVQRGDVVVMRTTRGLYHASAYHQAAMIAPSKQVIESTVEEIKEKSVPLQLPAPALEQPLELPGRCDFADHLGFWRPTPDEILIGLGPGGQRLTVPLKSLCHVALAGATGGGKSVIMRLLLSQILYVNARVALADPHFAPVDPESGEDWRPIVSRLAVPPCVSYDSIRAMLRWMAEQELPKRLEKRRQGIHPGDPFFLAIDELPAIVARVPEAPDYMGAILREGRKVGLFLVSAAQDWLVKTVGGSGGVRDCFRTAFYVGGDATSARVLLDVKGSVDDGSLGKGIVMLRSTATPKASLSRVPYASNDALVTLLGSPRSRMENLQPKPPLQNTPSSPRPHLHLVEVDTEGEHEAVSEGASQGDVVDSTPVALSELEKKIGEMFFSEGKNPNEIARLLWPDVKGGDAYRKNAALVADTIRKVASTKKVGA